MADDPASRHLMSLLGVTGVGFGHPEGVVPEVEGGAPEGGVPGQDWPSIKEPPPSTSITGWELDFT